MRYVAAAMAMTAALGTGVLAGPPASAAPKADGVFRPYSGSTGIAQELRSLAEQYPTLAKLESIGKTVQGKDILVVKVTKNARVTPDGARPGTLYLGAQHAREWITPEMTRRLLREILTGYGHNPQITSIVDTTELWFLPVANPDGYDYSFSDAPGARNWRKNLRDNNGDGKIAVGDGVDLNRNFGYKWGWDNEGSSPDQASDLYRGPGPTRSRRRRRSTLSSSGSARSSRSTTTPPLRFCCTASAGRPRRRPRMTRCSRRSPAIRRTPRFQASARRSLRIFPPRTAIRWAMRPTCTA
jgi:hypothetical protein